MSLSLYKVRAVVSIATRLRDGADVESLKRSGRETVTSSEVCVCLCVCVCVTHSLLRAKFPISHQMDLVGEVHAHCQFDEQVDAETVATLRDGGLTWTQQCVFNTIRQSADLTLYINHSASKGYLQV